MPPKASKNAPKPANNKSSPTTKSAPPAKKPAAAPKAAPRPAGNHNGVYVKNWGTGSVAEATEVFQKAGKVLSAQIRRHRYAIVFFDNAAAVKKAIDLFNDKVVLGKKVTVQPARTSPKPNPKDTSSTVFVSPIFRSSASKAQIAELFNGYKVLRLRSYRQNYVYAFLDSHASAEKFKAEKNGAEFRSHKLRVELSAKSLEKVKAHQQASKLLIEAHRHHKAQTTA